MKGIVVETKNCALTSCFVLRFVGYTKRQNFTRKLSCLSIKSSRASRLCVFSCFSRTQASTRVRFLSFWVTISFKSIRVDAARESLPSLLLHPSLPFCVSLVFRKTVIDCIIFLPRERERFLTLIRNPLLFSLCSKECIFPSLFSYSFPFSFLQLMLNHHHLHLHLFFVVVGVSLWVAEFLSV